jgi:ATP-dependent Clp protease ATP-binding subunit ClpB
VDFKNTIIVLTSNLGAHILVGADPVHPYSETPEGDIAPEVKNAVLDEVANNYPPEFINRIDSLIIFKRLSLQALRDIVDIRLKELQERLDDRRITLEASDEVRMWLAERGYDPKFGARPLNRLITTEIGNGLADKIIKGDLKMGETAIVEIKSDKSGLTVRSAN